MLRSFAVIIAVHASLFSLGCATSGTSEDRHPLPAFESVRAEEEGLSATLVRVLVSGDTSSDVGWFECELLLENRGDAPLVVSTVKLLTAGGRYLSPAASYGETLTPPNPAYDIAGGVATGAAGVAASQVTPYGGLVVRALADVVGASSADVRARADQRFRLRRVAGVELAPGGRMEGSAFFPRVSDSEALVIDFSQHGTVGRATLPLSRVRGL